jgi:Acylphosphatases
MTARRFLVSGRVQGVAFRWFVTHLGSKLGLRGVVRNLRDGRVEVVAAGTDSALAQLAQALAEGPPAARVDGVEGSQVEDEASLPKGFTVG